MEGHFYTTRPKLSTVPSSAIFIDEVVHMEQQMGRLENDMADVKIRLAVTESNIKEIRKDIGGIKDNTTWKLRLLIDGLVSARLALIIKGVLM
ncbi:hemolysin XhlA family protein [Lysinibacillus boronitolerans]|uniref:hemolysin XhlA family protein n=2 Tax=Lysinibacillus boronitolerans TaxID=309788 RepID=UPI003082C6D5